MADLAARSGKGAADGWRPRRGIRRDRAGIGGAGWFSCPRKSLMRFDQRHQKMVMLCYGVLKSRQPFDPHWFGRPLLGGTYS